MRSETIEIFGDPIPTAILKLAQAVDRAIDDAEQSTEAVQAANKKVSELNKRASSEVERRLSAEYLHGRNVGSHFYPGARDFSDVFTSDCEHCKCWMGPSRSGGPEGVDPFGECPGNPKLREAYELLKAEEPEKTKIAHSTRKD